jgi:hypothetical protein
MLPSDLDIYFKSAIQASASSSSCQYYDQLACPEDAGLRDPLVRNEPGLVGTLDSADAADSLGEGRSSQTSY